MSQVFILNETKYILNLNFYILNLIKLGHFGWVGTLSCRKQGAINNMMVDSGTNIVETLR